MYIVDVDVLLLQLYSRVDVCKDSSVRAGLVTVNNANKIAARLVILSVGTEGILKYSRCV